LSAGPTSARAFLFEHRNGLLVQSADYALLMSRRSDYRPRVQLPVRVVIVIVVKTGIAAMALWRLTPCEPQNLDAWRSSKYWGALVIRAADERAARGIASGAFLQSAAIAPHQEIRFSPWLQARLVACSRIRGTSEMAEDGAPGIVAPQKAVAIAQRER